MSPYTQLAKKAVEQYIKTGKTIKPPSGSPNEMLENKAGVFVTIKQKDALRGCIGTYMPSQENIAQETITNAISAASQDYRFSPIKEQDLASLSYTVYILEKPESIESKQELEPRKYGVLVKTLNFPPKKGLLLPQLDGIETAEQQFRAVCQKAGINPRKDKLMLFRFRAKKYD